MEHLKAVIELTRKMEALALKGDKAAVDNGCWALNGLIRDYAYELRARAEHERSNHDRKGGASYSV